MADSSQSSRRPRFSPSEDTSNAVQYLRTLPSVRERCQTIFQAASKGQTRHFEILSNKLNSVVDYVQALMDRDYSSYDQVPYHSRWRHFEVGGIDRAGQLAGGWGNDCGRLERARRLIDLVTVSVLLDAGAGDRWRYTEDGTGQCLTRSEGLGVASLHMFAAGGFSSDKQYPHRADSKGLQALPDDAVRKAFQAVDEDKNPLVGWQGRTRVLQMLGSAIEQHPTLFEAQGVFRPGNMVDYLFDQADPDTNEVSIERVWEVVMYGYEHMWPQGRTGLDGRSMGDVWRHSALPQDGSPGAGLVPFHKLSQWMTYSLMEPLEAAGLVLTDKHLMTGLPEYRNGGLLIDMGVLKPCYPEVTSEPHNPDEEVIVEWRALTVCLLDQIYAALRAKLGMTVEQFPLVKMLEGGTWKAGRAVAKEQRPDTGGPPIQIVSDGTVF